MTLEEAQDVLRSQKWRGQYIDTELHSDAIVLDGTFELEQVVALGVIAQEMQKRLEAPVTAE